MKTKSFKCVNCDGKHMALVKSCPEFLKERKIRELMSEFNCTYRKARMMYVDTHSKDENNTDKLKEGPYDKYYIPRPTPYQPDFIEVDFPSTFSSPIPPEEILNDKPTYAFAASKNLQTKAIVHDPPVSKIGKPGSKKHPTPKYVPRPSPEPEMEFVRLKPREEVSKTETKKAKSVSFSELIMRIKEIIFLKSDTIQKKVESVLKCCIEWLILVVVDNIADWPVLKYILDYLNG